MGCSTLINGKPVTVLDVNDRGVQYGDGLFETIAITQGQPEFLGRHLLRLESGCKRLHIDYPGHQILSEDIKFLCSERQSAVVKLQITSGNSLRGYRRPSCIVPNRIVTCRSLAHQSQSPHQNGIRLRLCRHRLSVNPTFAGIKHLNRLDQVIARNEWCCDDIQEGVMLDADGYVIEGTMSNLFLVSEGRLITALLDRAGVAGIVRSVILEQAHQHGVDVSIQRVRLADVYNADEIFMTNSVIGIWPVRQFETLQYQPGLLAQDARSWVLNAVDRLKA
ncbi:MAG TPA: aminodeoxychorismate lyase [Crenotrichaceae bacterium]|nr:aminodeoxychorismate lyase [Crenotrichaceae bacterium]